MVDLEPVYGGFRTRQICLSSFFYLIMDYLIRGYSQSYIFADHNIFIATTGVDDILKHFLDLILL